MECRRTEDPSWSLLDHIFIPIGDQSWSSSPYEINLNLHPHMRSIWTAIALLWIPFRDESLSSAFCKSAPASQTRPVIALILIKISHQPCMAGALFRSKVFLTPWAKKTWTERFYGCFRDCAQQVVARVSSKYWRWEWQIAISSDTPRALHPLNVLSTQIVISDNFSSPPTFLFPFVQSSLLQFSQLDETGLIEDQKMSSFSAPVEEQSDL